MDKTMLAQAIVDAVGGKGNIISVTHCVTRLRFKLRNESIVTDSDVKAVEGVLGVILQSGQYQVVIGPHVKQVYEEVLALGIKGAGEVAVDDAADGSGEHKTPGDRLLDTISGIFLPVVPALVGAGMIQAVLSIMSFAGVDAAATEYLIVNCFGQAAFYFLPLLLAHAAAVKFKTNPYVAMATVGALLIPNFVSLISNATADQHLLTFLGLPVGLVSYASTVFPALLIVLVESFVERAFTKVIPHVLQSVTVAPLTMLVMVPLALVALGPAGTYAGDALYYIITTVYGVAPWFVPALVGAITPLCIMTGMHFAGLIPITVMLLATSGFDSAVGPGMLCSNFAVAGACMAVFVRAHGVDLKALGMSTAIQSVLGIAEPAMFGVLIPLRTPFVATVAGGAIGGLASGAFGVGRYAQAGNSIISWVSFIGGDSMMNFYLIIAASILAFIAAFVCCFLLNIDEHTA